MTLEARRAQVARKTNETEITLALNLDGTGESRIRTGIGFLDHMLTTLARHARIDLELACSGDLAVDDHHTVEDCALTLGAAIAQALGDRRGVARFGDAYAPLDEALARSVVDLSGRPFASVRLRIRRDRLGTLSGENVGHVFRSLALAAGMTLHIDVLRGENDHHKAEAAFKAFALAIHQAVSRDGSESVPSTKGVLQ